MKFWREFVGFLSLVKVGLIEESKPHSTDDLIKECTFEIFAEMQQEFTIDLSSTKFIK